MQFSPLWFWALRIQLERELLGSIVSGGRISSDRLELLLRTNLRTLGLSLWLEPGWGRAELAATRTEGKLPEPWSALHGATCARVEQLDWDRRLAFTFTHTNGSLVLNYYGFTRPFVTLDFGGDKAIASTGVRGTAPTAPAVPFVLNAPHHLPTVWPADVALRDWLVAAFRGVDSYMLDAAIAATGINAAATPSRSDVEAIVSFFSERAAEYEKRGGDGYVIWTNREPVGVSFTDLSSWLPTFSFARHESLSRASAEFVRAIRYQATGTASRGDLLRRAKARCKKFERRLDQLRADHERQSDHHIWRQNADWLLSQLRQVRKGSKHFEVPTEEGVRIVELDPATPPEKQAERWYHLARRMRRGMKATTEQIQKTEHELDRLRQAVHRAEECCEQADPESELAWSALSDLVSKGGGRSTSLAEPQRPRDKPPIGCRRFRSPNGIAIWVGRTDAENNELTFRHAHKRDLWFHAQQCPGSHVVLRCHAQKKPPSRGDILAAAATAAFYSKARNSSKVPVIYAEARYVRKPRKAPPGEVLVEREKSVMVEPAKLPEWDEDAKD